MTVTTYAIGATIGAPFLTAMTSNWSRKSVMLITMIVFSLGSLAATLSVDVHMMLISRFVAGLAHGLFLAVSASVATQIVAPEKKGAAVACVFAGLTLALALGVPAGTYLGSIISWRLSFMSVTICGVIGLLGIIFLMPNIKINNIQDSTRPLDALKNIFNPTLLLGALITVFGYTGAFTLYTYISPLLLDVTKVGLPVASSILLIYGICAAIGNLLGGKLSDKLGVDRAVVWIMLSLAITLIIINFYSTNRIAMCILIGAMGAISYAAVPAMQARVISIAHRYVPGAVPVASGLNIAGFNSGIALGSLLGGVIISTFGIHFLAMGGALITSSGLLILMVILHTKNINAD